MLCVHQISYKIYFLKRDPEFYFIINLIMHFIYKKNFILKTGISSFMFSSFSFETNKEINITILLEIK